MRAARPSILAPSLAVLLSLPIAPAASAQSADPVAEGSDVGYELAVHGTTVAERPAASSIA